MNVSTEPELPEQICTWATRYGLLMFSIYISPDATRYSLTPHASASDHTTIVIMYTMLLLTSRWIDLWLELRTPEITSLKPNFCQHDFPDKIWIDREKESSFRLLPIQKFDANRNFVATDDLNTTILKKVVTWVPKMWTIDLNGNHKNQVHK